MGKMYFNNDMTENYISEYKKTRDVKYRNLAIVEIGKIVDAIINVYQYWRWESRDVLQSEAFLACLKAIEKFDRCHERSSSAFNYFSLVCKKHLAFITTKETRYKGRNYTTDNSILYNIINSKAENVSENKISELIHFLERCLFKKSTRKLRIVDFLKKYINLNQNFFEKRDFINYAKSYGITQSYLRKVMKEIENSIQLYAVYTKHINTFFSLNPS